MNSSRPLCLLLLFLICALPSAADDRWTVRFFASYLETSGSLRDAGPGQTLEIDLSGDVGFGAAIERRFGERWGVELSALTTEVESRVDLTGLNFEAVDVTDFRFVPVTLGLNYHVDVGERADLYFGPLVGQASYGDLEAFVDVGFVTELGFDPGDRVELEDDIVYGAQIGLDLPVGESGWGFNSSLRYLVAELAGEDEGPDDSTIDLDPLIATAGLSYRF
ncbi:MAG: OmpW family outer membrane protein [Acidobacteriota bacterium]